MTCSTITGAYVQRKPRQSPHFKLVEDYFEALERAWDDHYAKKLGYWRAHVQKTIFSYLDCGDFHKGFARIRCTSCDHEFILPFSCKRRNFCPTCHERRVLEFGEFLASEVLTEDVPHRHWVFSMPKMLRGWFMFDRKLLGALAHIVWEVLSKYIVASSAAGLSQDVKAACIMSIQTYGEQLNFNPHIHVIAADGCFDSDGAFTEAWALDMSVLKEVFATAVFRLLSGKGLSEGRIETIMSWQHSGFQVYRGEQIRAGDTDDLERLSQYIVRSPIALSRMTYDRENAQVFYNGKTTGVTKVYPALDFLAQLIAQIPAPREQMVRYLGFYSNKSRGMRKKESSGDNEVIKVVVSRRPGSKRWAQLIAKVYLVDPLTCPKCQKPMRIVSFIESDDAIAKILKHLGLWELPVAHAPPPIVFEDCYVDEYSQLPPAEFEFEAC